MSQKNKLQRFAEVSQFPNTYENFTAKDPKLVANGDQEVNLVGQWREKHFKNEQPIILELACGRGEYSVEMGRRIADRNFVGVDIKGARIWKGAKMAMEEELHHVAFLRSRIEVIDQFFAPGEIDEIWITFPDPFERKNKVNRRLTSQNFLSRFRKFLKPGGPIHLKTDADSLYAFTLETIAEDPNCVIEYQNDDIYSGPLENPLLEIKTYYERMHLEASKTIKYVRFRCH